MLAVFLVLVAVDAGAAVEVAFQQAVDHEVGVAADGGGEVGVEGECQAVVADVVGAVVGFGHGADGDGVDHVLLAAAGDVLEEAVVAVGQGFAAGGLHAEAQFGDKLDEGVQLLGVGFVVDAVDEGFGGVLVFRFAYVFGDGAVGQEHEFLDEPVGLLAFFDVDADGLGVFVELEFHLLGLEVDGAGFEACLAEARGEGVEGHDGVGDGSAVACAGVDDGLRFLVGHAAVAADDGLAHPAFEDFGFGVHLHDDAEAELLLVLAQRADIVAEFFGQHGDGAVDEVDAGAAVVGLAVDGAAGLYIVRHIGDVHAHFDVTVFQLAVGEGVVEVLGVGGVDGEGEHVAEVAAGGHLFFGGFADFLGLVFGLFGELQGEVVFGEDGLHLHVVVAGFAQALDHFAHGVVHAFGPVGHLHEHLLAVFGAAEVVDVDEDVDVHGAAVADHEGEALLLLDDADEACLGALDDFHHLSFGLVHLALREHEHADGVAVQCMVGVVGGYLYVLGGRGVGVLGVGLGYDVGLAALLHVDGACDIVLRHQVVVDALGVDFVFALVVVLDEVVVLGELLDGADDLLAFSLAACAYARGDLLVVEGVEGIVDKDFEYLFG